MARAEFFCNACRGRIREVDEVCPHCGKVFDAAAGAPTGAGAEADSEYFCAKCQGAVEADDLHCPHCGADVSGPVVEEKSAPREEAAGDEAVPDPRPSLEDLGIRDLDPLGGAGVLRDPRQADPPAADDEGYVCDACGHPVTADEVTCPGCGADVSEVEEDGEEEPELEIEKSLCSVCQSEVKDHHKFCPGCGAQLEDDEEVVVSAGAWWIRQNRWGLLVAVLAFIFILWIILRDTACA